MGRKRPYTPRGISRVPCIHCNAAPAAEQWRKDFCADNHEVAWLPLCLKCDIALNDLLLRFFNVSDVDEKMKRYIASKTGEVSGQL
jgi:hypothetical protein